MTTVRNQIQNNAVALISLVIAVSALAYNTWRNEKTEDQRNIRHASFRVLESLGEIQQVVDYRYYYLPFEEQHEREGELRIRGFGQVSLVRDLTSLMPPPGPQSGQQLQQLWLDHFHELNQLNSSGQHSPAATLAEQELTQQIRITRESVLTVLARLD